jgi:26S proteasome regulatory subunit T1
MSLKYFQPKLINQSRHGQDLVRPRHGESQKYVGEDVPMNRELFTMAGSKRACTIFFDEIGAIGGARTGGDESGSDNEEQRIMLQIVTEMDSFDACGNTKVLMATNRPGTPDPALLRPGRLDR